MTKEKLDQLATFLIATGLLDMLIVQFRYFQKNSELNLDKFFLGFWPLLFVIIFFYQRSKLGFGFAVFYLVFKLFGALMVLYIYGIELGLERMFMQYPLSLESILESVLAFISGLTIALLYVEYWKKMSKNSPKIEKEKITHAPPH